MQVGSWLLRGPLGDADDQRAHERRCVLKGVVIDLDDVKSTTSEQGEPVGASHSALL
jgi:hypothetical protein